MARTTRSKGGAASATTSKSQASTSESRYTLPPASSNPPRIFVLPTKATTEARVVSLLNPRLARPTRYLVCPETGFYEFTKIAAPKSTPRSWLIQCDAEKGTGKGGKVSSSSEDVVMEGQAEETNGEKRGDDDGDEYSAYVTKGAELYIATPVDPMFLLLPALTGEATAGAGSRSRDEKKQLFLSLDDHLETITSSEESSSSSSSPHLNEILRRWCGYGDDGATPTPLRRLLEARAAAVCDSVPAGDETMYRLSEPRVLGELLAKARRTAGSDGKSSLPSSMEERFVTKALEAPVLSVKREASGASGTSTPAAADSQSSAADGEKPAEDDAGELELRPAIVASPEVVALQRLRVAFSYLLASYVSPGLATRLRALLEKKDGTDADDAKSTKKKSQKPSAPESEVVDFGPLDEYLARVAQLRREATSARSASDYSRKRAMDEDEAAERAEKKRKKEEEEKKKKAGQSRGVKELNKVNTTGMRKMSDFFKKK